jgi:hypothetical protein
MDRTDSPYVFREERQVRPRPDPEGRDIVIVEGRAMSYRAYRR